MSVGPIPPKQSRVSGRAGVFIAARRGSVGVIVEFVLAASWQAGEQQPRHGIRRPPHATHDVRAGVRAAPHNAPRRHAERPDRRREEARELVKPKPDDGQADTNFRHLEGARVEVAYPCRGPARDRSTAPSRRGNRPPR